MTERLTAFRRMLVGLPQSTSDYATLRATAELAELLRLSLVATFVEDESLTNIAGLPFARELRMLGGGWQPIEMEKLAAEMAGTAATAQRVFADVVQHCSIETSFSLAKGSPAAVIGSIATSEDIIVVIEPRNPAERFTQQFTELVAAAFRANASVMIIPNRISRSTGPVVAVAVGPEDPSIPAALGIAAAAREKLIIVSRSDEFELTSELSRLIESSDVKTEIAQSRRRAVNASMLAADLHGLNERLLVVTRGTIADAEVPALASLRSVPVVIVEPRQMKSG
jgi:hypothetical protein